MRRRKASYGVKVTKVDNTAIQGFFAALGLLILEWNQRRESIGKEGFLVAILEKAPNRGTTDEQIVKIDPGLSDGRSARMTFLSIRWDRRTCSFLAHTPGLPVQDELPVSLDHLYHVLDRYEP